MGLNVTDFHISKTIVYPSKKSIYVGLTVTDFHISKTIVYPSKKEYICGFNCNRFSLCVLLYSLICKTFSNFHHIKIVICWV